MGNTGQVNSFSPPISPRSDRLKEFTVRNRRSGFAVVSMVLALIVPASGQSPRSARHNATKTAASSGDVARPVFGALPLAFEPNLGQVDERIRYISRGSGYALLLTNEAALIKLEKRSGTSVTRTVVASTFAGGARDAQLSTA